MSTMTKADPASAGSARPLSGGRRIGDRGFALLALVAGLLVLVILVLIAVSTAQQSTSWFSSSGWSGVFSTTFDQTTNQFGMLAFLYGTVITSIIAIIIAVPFSVSIGLLLTEVVPRRWATPIVYVIDLLAVVPSVVWGLWGILVFAPWLNNEIYTPVASGLNGVPVLGSLFGQPNVAESFMTAGIVLGIMVIPIITSLSREVIATVPTTDKEGAYALGATRWEMIRGAVWPHSQGGVVGACLVGLGRAMGETIAAALLIGSQPVVTSKLLSAGYSIPAGIANLFPDASGEFRSFLIGMGLILFIITIIVNLGARGFVARSARKMRGA
jgi:phosphate transport system permease protein